MVAVPNRLARTARVLAWTRSPAHTAAAVRRGCLADVETLVRAGGSVRGGRLELGAIALRVPPADFNAAWHVHHLLGGEWTLEPTDGGYLVRLGARGPEFFVPEGLLADALGAFVERFEYDEYARLDVRDAVVVDIGAYIGDSTVYLLGRGARHVHAYEPFPLLAEVARANFERNGLADRVTLHTAGVGWPPGPRAARFEAASSMMSSTSAGGQDTVEIVAFATVLETAIGDAPGARLVCKVDCEGAEYEFFGPGLTPAAFDAVDALAIECHGGGEGPVIRELEDQGLAVTAAPTGGMPGAPVMILAERPR